jgi:hypothetical protein
MLHNSQIVINLIKDQQYHSIYKEYKEYMIKIRLALISLQKFFKLKNSIENIASIHSSLFFQKI